MSITCPECHAELEPQNGVAHCDNCNKDIRWKRAARSAISRSRC
jgi:Zn finger protein HypA/HybF involved in hydrogenase expression